MTTTEILRGELERLFELDDLKRISTDLLGLSLDEIGSASGKGAFARSLVDLCVRQDSLEALADAVLFSAKGVDDRVRQVFEGQRGQDLSAGTVVAGFRVLKKIGEGGVGSVYLAERKDENATTRVALKVVRADYARDRSASRRFLTAARALRGITAQGLAPIHAVGTLEDGRPYIATEFIEGQTLAARVSRVGPMHFNEAKSVLRSVFEALSTLHNRGLVHGDLKTENVFVVRPQAEGAEPYGVFVDAAVDRLLARGKLAADRTGFFPVFGTAKAISPEQARGQGTDARSDVYSAGVLMFELLTGKQPFAGASGIDIVAQHLNVAPPVPSQVAPRGWISKQLDEIILKALEKDPAKRYGSVVELREALESFSRVSARPPALEKIELNEADFEAAKKALFDAPSDDDYAGLVESSVAAALAWDKAIAVFTEAAEKASDNATKKNLLFRVARIAEQEAKDNAAAEAALAKIIELDADDNVAHQGLEDLRRRAGNFEGLADLLIEKTTRVSAGKPRSALLQEIAGIYEDQLKNSESAFAAWVSALSEDASDAHSVSEVERLASADTNRWNEAFTTLSEAAAQATDNPTKVRLYTLMGGWYADKLQRPDFAISCYQQALAADPTNETALDGTLGLYRRAQAWTDLAPMLQKRAEAASIPSKARDFRAEAAEIYANKLNDLVRATDLLTQILIDDPAHPTAATALEGIYSRQNQWDALAKLLEKKAAHQHGDEKAETLCGIAEIEEDRLSNDDKAVVHYEAALLASPKHVNALKGLERVYAKIGKFEPLLQNLRTQLENAATPRQKIALFERIGGILEEEFVDLEKAALSFESVIEIEAGNENANAALSRLYRKLGRFTELGATIERHARSTSDEARKVALLLSAAKVFVVDVHSPEHALALAEQVIALDPNHAEALELTARVKGAAGDANAALSAVEKLAAAEKDPAKRAALFVRGGKIFEERGDYDRAIDNYKIALDADAKSLEAFAALRSIYTSRGDAHGAAELLTRELAITESGAAKAKLLAELGSLYADRLGEKEKARAEFKKALELDAMATGASWGLGSLAFEAGDYLDAVRYLEPLLPRTTSMPTERAKLVGLRCGDAFRKLGKNEKAHRAYFDARAIAPEDPEVLERVANALFETGDPDAASDLYRNLLKARGDSLVGAERGKLLLRFGEALRSAGVLAEAETNLKLAVEHLPGESEPTDLLTKLYEQQGKWENLLTALRERMDQAGDDERFALLARTGDILVEKIKDKPRAIKSYVAALELKGDDRNVLVKLMNLYGEAKDWSRLVEVVLRIAELVTDKASLAKYYTTAAAISHFELQRLDEAADYYEQALDQDAAHAPAFKGLVDALSKNQSWDRLGDAYRAQIKRLSASEATKEKAAIYDAFGELLRTKLNSVGHAVEAFEEAQKLDPENKKRAEILAEIYAVDPKKYFEKSTALHAQLLAIDPYRTESYQSLRKLYSDAGRTDESFAVAQALHSLNLAHPDDEAIFKKHRSAQPVTSRIKISSKIFQENIVHRAENPLLTSIFTALSPAVLATRSQSLSTYGVDAAAKISASDNIQIAALIREAAATLGLSDPALYRRENDAGGLSYLATNPPSIGVGKGALAGGAEQTLAFVAARHVAYYRQGYYLRHMLPAGGGLRSWLLASIKFATPTFPTPIEIASQVEENVAAIRKHIDNGQQEHLLSDVHKLLADAPELNLVRWVSSVDLAADRVGFVLANDLEAAVAVIKASPDDVAAVSQKERLKELYAYSVSDAYLALRKKLEISVQG